MVRIVHSQIVLSIPLSSKLACLLMVLKSGYLWKSSSTKLTGIRFFSSMWPHVPLLIIIFIYYWMTLIITNTWRQEALKNPFEHSVQKWVLSLLCCFLWRMAESLFVNSLPQSSHWKYDAKWSAITDNKCFTLCITLTVHHCKTVDTPLNKVNGAFA